MQDRERASADAERVVNRAFRLGLVLILVLLLRPQGLLGKRA